MATKTIIPIRGKRLRITQLDSCGRITSASLQLVTEGFITVRLTSQTEDGVDIIVKNANGAVWFTDRGNPSFQGFGVEVDLAEVNPSLVSMMTNAEDYDNASGDVAGITVAEGEITGRFALELWTGLAGEGACGAEGEEASGYMLLPLITSGTLADMEVGSESAVTFGVRNAKTIGGNTWGEGPYKVMGGVGGGATATKLPEALTPLQHFLLVETKVAPPVATTSPTAIPA